MAWMFATFQGQGPVIRQSYNSFIVNRSPTPVQIEAPLLTAVVRQRLPDKILLAALDIVLNDLLAEWTDNKYRTHQVFNHACVSNVWRVHIDKQVQENLNVGVDMQDLLYQETQWHVEDHDWCPCCANLNYRANHLYRYNKSLHDIQEKIVRVTGVTVEEREFHRNWALNLLEGRMWEPAPEDYYYYKHITEYRAKRAQAAANHAAYGPRRESLTPNSKGKQSLQLTRAQTTGHIDADGFPELEPAEREFWNSVEQNENNAAKIQDLAVAMHELADEPGPELEEGVHDSVMMAQPQMEEKNKLIAAIEAMHKKSWSR
ncbi:MAG: hypothetical protein Q9162_004801 [Coniocarpon cinnabarinum]